MNKLLEIAQAWISAANPTKEQKEIAEHRIKKCETCPHVRYVSSLDLNVCGICTCPLNKKIFSPLPGPQACPDDPPRWEK